MQAATAAATTNDLRDEIREVGRLVALAERVYAPQRESKFRQLQAALGRYPDAKVLIFTEYRDTADFLTQRLGALGFAGQVARIDGTMPWRDRERQVALFRGPARFLVATDAAGEGINLQFCWLTVNYDVPWNPARLEQRLGRVHRYGQRHDVVALNMIARRTREGRVLEVLFDKLERMRERLSSDRVYDVLGEVFEDRPLPELIAEAVLEGRDEAVAAEVGRRLDEQLPAAVVRRVQGPVPIQASEGLLGPLRLRQEQAERTRVMPSYVAGLFRAAATRQGIRLEGDPGDLQLFHIPDPPPPVARALQAHAPELREQLTFDRLLASPPGQAEPAAVYLHPGEPIYESVVAPFLGRYADEALRGAVFRDPAAERPYFFTLAGVPVLDGEGVAPRLVGQALSGVIWDPDAGFRSCAPHLLLTVAPDPAGTAQVVDWTLPSDAGLAEWVQRTEGEPLLARIRAVRDGWVAVSLDELHRGLALREADLLAQRARLLQVRAQGQPLATHWLRECETELDELPDRRAAAEAALRAEVTGLRLGEVTVWVRALVLPGAAADLGAPFGESEAMAMAIARQVEEREGAVVLDRSDPWLRLGYDLESRRLDGSERWIEVKGRADTGPVELTENEWRQAANHRDRYWLYVVWNCRTQPRLRCIPDPFGALLSRQQGGVRIDASEIGGFPEEVIG